MSFIEGLIEELRASAPMTRKLLERVPADKLDWKPGAKAMTLGQLAFHIATIPGVVSGMIQNDVDITGMDFVPPVPESYEQIAEAFEQNLADAEQRLRAFSDARLAENWKVKKGDDVMMEMPVSVALRNILFNHLYHHRGQLATYFRCLGVPVPAVFGTSADENPFAESAAAAG